MGFHGETPYPNTICLYCIASCVAFSFFLTFSEAASSKQKQQEEKVKKTLARVIAAASVNNSLPSFMDYIPHTRTFLPPSSPFSYSLHACSAPLHVSFSTYLSDRKTELWLRAEALVEEIEDSTMNSGAKVPLGESHLHQNNTSIDIPSATVSSSSSNIFHKPSSSGFPFNATAVAASSANVSQQQQQPREEGNDFNSTTTTGKRPQLSHSASMMPNNATVSGRKLQIVLVLDKKVQKSLKVREMASADIEAVACSLNVNLQLIDFDRLDYGEAKTLDSFYNADIALVDFTITHQQPSLCYHVGVRESMGQNYNIIIMYFPDEKAEVRIMDALKKTLAHLHLIIYFLSEKDSPVLLSADKSYKLERRQINSQTLNERLYPQKVLTKGRSVRLEKSSGYCVPYVVVLKRHPELRCHDWID
uniref:MAP3K deoxyribohydrolase domain-containing protein n=1 Tax=Ditylenchus dipsaci TaxID=166011 RepID=A0A915EP06_9BILA